jgi:hypothetical protein
VVKNEFSCVFWVTSQTEIKLIVTKWYSILAEKMITGHEYKSPKSGTIASSHLCLLNLSTLSL